MQRYIDKILKGRIVLIENKMQIIIPMSGFGERFKRAGYDVPKPLIEVNGKPIIEYIIDMFPDENNFTFICNREHLDEPKYKMRQIINKIAPDGKILAIEPHKLGPVNAVLGVIDEINLDQPTIVNYADFTCDWDYRDFCKYVERSTCDGAIPCYRGFHPHTLWSNYYAYVREEGKRVNDIQEKKPFTSFPRKEFASSGTYYFKSGDLMKKYFERCVSLDLKVGGEYYVSMVYKPMIEDELNIQIYELKHFMQWGVPSDLEEYNYWSEIFKSILNETEPPEQNGSILLPMVGLGTRFQKEGYQIAKPLITVSSKPMAIQALMDLPIATKQRFVLRDDMDGVEKLKKEIKKFSKSPEFSLLSHMTDGQASTCIEGGEGLEENKPVTIAACDNGMIYDSAKFTSLMNSYDVDVIVWGARGYPGAIRNPKMYGWVNADENGLIENISVKKALNDPSKDPIVVGCFTFKKFSDFKLSVRRMKDRKAKVNNEYYVDTAINDAINLGLKCVIFEIDHYICWGTPNDLRTFEYWQNCFDKWDGHPYKKEKDRNMIKIS
jgi:NDP-sugar pyrophosphorylase family protein